MPLNLPIGVGLNVGVGPQAISKIGWDINLKKYEDFLRESQKLGLEFNIPATMRESGRGGGMSNFPHEVWSLPEPGVTSPDMAAPPFNPPVDAFGNPLRRLPAG